MLNLDIYFYILTLFKLGLRSNPVGIETQTGMKFLRAMSRKRHVRDKVIRKKFNFISQCQASNYFQNSY